MSSHPINGFQFTCRYTARRRRQRGNIMQMTAAYSHSTFPLKMKWRKPRRRHTLVHGQRAVIEFRQHNFQLNLILVESNSILFHTHTHKIHIYSLFIRNTNLPNIFLMPTIFVHRRAFKCLFWISVFFSSYALSFSLCVRLDKQKQKARSHTHRPEQAKNEKKVKMRKRKRKSNLGRRAKCECEAFLSISRK